MKGTISDFVVTCIKEEKKLMDFYEFDGKIRNPEKMRIVGSKASYETTSSIAEKLMEISKWRVRFIVSSHCLTKLI